MVSVLREEIVNGTRPAGEYLPSEVALGEQFQLSKNSVRKGLDMLVAENLLEKVPRVGNRVVGPTDEGVVSIKFGYYKSVMEEGLLNQFLSDFHAEHPHIRVQSIPLPYEQFAETASEYMRSDMLDVMTINYTDFRHMEEGGLAELLEPLEPNRDMYAFLSKTFADKNQTIRALPFIFSPVVLCYNRDHFTQRQLPEPDSGWTWNDLLETAAKLSGAPGRYGFYFHPQSDNRWPVFLLQTGVRFARGGEGEERLTERELKESMALYRQILDDPRGFPGYMSESDSDAEDLFLQGKLSVVMTTYFSLNRFMDAPFSFDVAPLPYTHEARTLLLAVGVAMSRNTKVREGARTFLDYILSYRAQLKIRQQTLSIPSCKKAAEWRGKEEGVRPSRFHMYREIIPTFRLFTELNLDASQLETVRKQLKLYWSNMENEQAVIQRLNNILPQPV